MERKQIRGLTIDARSTRDIDDALWVEKVEGGWQVDVTIADVASAVPLGSEHDEQARRMVTTKYFATGNSPMLPRDLSEDSCSLWAGRERNGISIRMHLSETFDVLDSEVVASTLSSDAKLAYEDVPKILANSENKHHSVLTGAARLAVGLMERRRNAGAFVLYDMNNGWVSTEEGYIRQLKNIEETIGYVVIQELMVLTNATVAKFAIDKNIPFVFRNHCARAAAPSRDVLMQQVEDAIKTPMVDIDVVRERVHMLLDRATYGETVLGHYGLNLPVYTHFTSPIRRYPDLINHRQLLAHLSGTELPYSNQQLQEVSAAINEELNNERNSKAAYLKSKAEDRAVRLVSARRLDGLGAKDFERVTKVECRSGEAPSDAFRDSFLLRLRHNRVPLICATTIVTEAVGPAWQELRIAVVNSMAQFPADAQSLLAQAAAIAGWAVPNFAMKEEGPDHARTFTATASMALDDRSIESDPYPASTAKEAKQRAVVGLLAKLVGAPTPRFTQLAPAAPSKKTKHQTVNLTKDPVAALQEYTQANGAPSPEYSFEESGPKHIPTFIGTCKLQDKVVSASGTSKALAKKAAAKKMVELLAELRPTAP